MQGGNFKKMHSVRVVSSSIIWGKMRSSGGSISDSSENLLHKDMGEGQGICSLGEGRAHAFKCRFFAEGYC